MFSAFSISCFRGFKKLKVEPLSRFNLLIGRNNVGKTAALEALYLLCGPTNPELPLRLNSFRGLELVSADPESLWGWLFYEKNLKRPINLELETRANQTRTLEIRLGERAVVPLRTKAERSRPVSSASASTSSAPSELNFTYHGENGGQAKTKAFLSDRGVVFECKSIKVPDSVYVSARAGYSAENPERFSRLEEVGKEGELLPALRLLEPRLRKLAVSVTPTGPLLHGDIGLLRMVPLPMMGDGIGRLLTLLLSLTASKGGLLLIDEIDTGLHYSVMVDVWTAIATSARDADVQVFATTHSLECIRAAQESFTRSDPYDLSIHRLDRDNSGDIAATYYDEEMLETALSSGLEVR